MVKLLHRTEVASYIADHDWFQQEQIRGSFSLPVDCSMPVAHISNRVINQCFICRRWFDIDDISAFRRALREHIKIVHTDYFSWTRKLRVILLLSLLVGALLAVSPTYFIPGIASPWSLFYAGILFMVPIVIFGVYVTVKLRSFKGNWADQHRDSPINSPTQSPR